MTKTIKTSLDEIRNRCLNCHKCRLGDSRHNIVFDDGAPNPKLMLIGEAPGYYEDMQGCESPCIFIYTPGGPWYPFLQREEKTGGVTG